MTVLEMIRLVIGVCLLLMGLAVFIIEIFGVYRYQYVLNRMHAAALGDTMGLALSLFGLMFLSGWNITTVKMMMVVAFLWISSPVSSHMLAKVEVDTNEVLDSHCEQFASLEALEGSIQEDLTEQDNVGKDSGMEKKEEKA